MSDSTKKLLELIGQNKTINEICDSMGVSHKQLFNHLTVIRNKGFDFDRKYYDTGDIVYVPKKNIDKSERFGVNIITDKNSSNFTAMVISDIHFGSGFEIEGIMDKVYNYCVREGIHNIIVAGDLLDGTFSRVPQRITDSYDQIEYFFDKYPFDKSIINYVLLGDHDFSILKNTGQDFSRVLDSYRHDIVPLGYFLSCLNVKNDVIGICHNANQSMELPTDCNLLFVGHTHNSRVNSLLRKNSIYLPSLSGVNRQKGNNGNSMPGGFIFTAYFANNIINAVHLVPFVVNDDICCVTDISFTVSSMKKGDFNNIEDYSKVFIKQ